MLERLPNELLLEVFEYLDAAQLLRAFLGLNRRFNNILFNEFYQYRVNFRFIDKYISRPFVQECFPLIIKRIISLQLSDNKEERPRQTDLFFSLNLQLNQFIHLRSLSLCHIDHDVTMRKLMNDCRQLPHLTHLKVIKCHSTYMCSLDFSNIAWSLLKLTHCRFQMDDNSFHVPTIVSLTLKYVSISCESWGLNEIRNLLLHTPHLQHLHVPLNKFNDDDHHHQTLSCATSITILKLSDVRSSHTMINILQAMPNLTDLKVDAKRVDCDGYRWEDIIDTHLPNLKVFHLRMRIELLGEKNNEEHVDQLIDTFRSQFWLEKHQWFVRCHYKSERRHMAVLLYTLPYAFIDFNPDQLTIPYTSTCPSADKYLSYDQVNNISFNPCMKHVLFIRFPNIRKLTISLPIDEHLWGIIPALNQLQSLTITSNYTYYDFQIQPLLNKIYCLNSLTNQAWLNSETLTNQNHNALHRRLDIRFKSIRKYEIFCDKESCESFINSPFGMQCEELLIKAQSPRVILDLVNGMRNLRILTIHFQLDCKYSSHNKDYTTEINVLIGKLQEHLPSTSTITNYDSHNLLWIFREKY